MFDNIATLQTGGIQGKLNSTILIDKMINYGNNGVTGGGMGFWDSDVTITRSTLHANIATESGFGIFLDECQADISDVIIWGSSTDQVYSNLGNHSITYSVIKGGFEGEGNIDGNPLFENAYFREFQLTWDSYPFPDNQKSSCIDNGNPLSDLDPDGTRADIGAFTFEQVYTNLPGGDINGTLTCAESPYYVNGDLTVISDDELIIEPCVSLVFQGDYRLDVNGRLLAEGTETDKISFFPEDTITGWQGIRFYNQNSNGQDSSKLVNCRIVFGNADGYNWDAYGGGVYFNNSSEVVLNNCLFTKTKRNSVAQYI